MKRAIVVLLSTLLLSSCAFERFTCPEYPMLDASKREPPYYPHCFLPEGEGAA